MSSATSVRAQGTLPVLAVSCLITLTLLVVYLPGTETTRMSVLAAVVALVAAWVTAMHPVAILRCFALVLALVPYFHVPGTDIPLLLVLSLGIWVALLFLPGVQFRPGWPEFGLALLAGVAALSVVATVASVGALTEYAAWLAATAVVVPLRFLPDAARAACIRAFVLGCAVSSVVGIVLLRLDPQGLFLSRLSFAGYDTKGDNAQLVPGTESDTLRLTGTFVEPNIAGLILALGLLLAVATTRGVSRAFLSAVIGAALLLTLSRAALGTVVVAVVVLVIVSGGRRRFALLGAGAAAAVGSLAIPTVRERLFNSFGPNDTGSLARSLAFDDFPEQLQGHWWWGLGWDREEFRDPDVGRLVNFVANAPMLTIYRGGIVLGAVAVVILIAIVLRSLVGVRRSFEHAVLASGVVAFSLVALQLDFPVVIQAPATAAFSVLLGFSLQSRHPPAVGVAAHG